MYIFVRFPEFFVLFPDILSESEGLLSWVEEMPEDRFTTLPSGGFSVETQISDNKGSDRASFVSYLDPIQPSARQPAI